MIVGDQSGQMWPDLQDRLGKRLGLAIVCSFVLNVCAWSAVAAYAKHPVYISPRPVEITRVTIDRHGRKIEHKITREQIKRHVVQIRKPIPVQTHVAVVRHVQQPPQPQAAQVRSHVIAALDKGQAQSNEPVVEQGSGVTPGVPIEQPKEEIKATPAPEVKAPTPAVVTPAPVKPMPAPMPTPPVVKPPDPAPIIRQPDPAPVQKGPTREAQPSDQVKPEIPDSLKHGDFKSFVRVRVEINEDGTALTVLRTSSGNAEIDQRVLDALKRWRWKPALQNGQPVSSVQLFKFEFLVD